MTPITTIKQQVAEVIAHSQNIGKEMNAEALIQKWYEAKRQFFEAWGDYIYEVEEPVTFYLSKEEKQHRFNEYIDVVDNTYGNCDLTEFLDWLTIDEVFDNHISRDYWISGEDKIAKGTKVSKAFKYFESNETVLRKIQDQLSMILQEDKITGTLCLSVHPLDYLSVSENTYHWRSCHALDGDYRAGNLQYMVDKCTIVCYLRGIKNAELPNFPKNVLWNSKKWRMLLFVSDNQNALFAGRQYPFFSPSALDRVQEAFLSSTNKRIRAWTPWYNDYIQKFPRKDGDIDIAGADNDSWLNQRYIALGGMIFGTRQLIKECKKPLFFNDLTESSFYIPYYSWNRYANREYIFHIGDSVPCPCCNGEHDVRNSEFLICEECLCGEEETHYIYCDCCDCRMSESEGSFVQSAGHILCNNCFEEHTVRCDKCGEYWYSHDIQYDRENDRYLCPDCRGARTRLTFDFEDDLPY